MKRNADIGLFTKPSNFAPVAQGIGRQPPELKIAGSNPAGRTKQKQRVGKIAANPFLFPYFLISTLLPIRRPDLHI
jgi:hypothetical protein